MEIKSKKIKYTYLIPLVIILAALLGAAIYYAARYQNSDAQTPISIDSPPTEEQITDGQNTKLETIESQEKPNIPRDKPDEGTESELPLTVSAINQNESSLQVRILIDRILADGTCTIELTMGSLTVSKTANIFSLPGNSTCEGFDIANSELSPGTWHYQITAVSGGKTGTTSGSVEVR